MAGGIKVTPVKLCAWSGVSRRMVHDKPTTAAPTGDPGFCKPTAMIKENPSFGYRTAAFLLGVSRNAVQPSLRLRTWQVRQRPVSMRPRIQTLRPRRARAGPPISAGSGSPRTDGPCRLWSLTAAGVRHPSRDRQGDDGRQCAKARQGRPFRHLGPRPPHGPAQIGQRHPPSGLNRRRLNGSFLTSSNLQGAEAFRSTAQYEQISNPPEI